MPLPLLLQRELVVEHLGKEVPYAEGLCAMRERMAELQADPEQAGALYLLEHRPVITVTRSGGLAHLLASPEDLARDGVELIEADRGGDVTFHGPGQLVGYPVVRLRQDESGRVDLLGYLRALETGLVNACTRLGVAGCHRKEGMTGVWVGDERDERKLVAIGVGVNKGVTRHGFALNVDIDLERYTSRIVPCGLVGRGVTSLLRELGPSRVPDEEELLATVVSDVAAALGALARAQGTPSSRRPSSRKTGGEASPDGAFHG